MNYQSERFTRINFALANHPDAEEGDTGALKATKKRVLIIDDDPISLIVTAEILRQNLAQTQITSCESVEDFREQNIGLDAFDLIISDHHLGHGKTGLAFWDEVKADRPDVPFMLMSGIGKSKFETIAAGLTASPHFVEKPLIPERFQTQVRKLLK